MEKTVIAQRIVYEGIHRAGGPAQVNLTDELLRAVRNSHRQYIADQKKMEEQKSEGQKRLAAKRKATCDLNKAVAEKKKVVDDMKKKLRDTINQFDAEISTLQEKADKR